MIGNRFGLLLLAGVIALGSALPAEAQSLNPKAPTPLASGENHGTLDNLVGPQYWSFKYRKGSATLEVRFSSMGLFGNPMAATMEVVLHSPDGKVLATRTLTSRGQVATLSWPGTFAGPGTAVVEIRPAGSNLVRNGGDYTISVVGNAVDFATTRAAPAGPEQIVGTYAVMVYPPDWNFGNTISIHFSKDGTVATTDGHRGTWTVFDPESLIYTVVIGPDRWSLKLVPGRGLFNTNDLSVTVFQALRPH